MGSSLIRLFVAVFVNFLSWRRSIAYPTSSNESTPCEYSLSVEIPNAILHENGSAWDPDGRVLYAEGTHWMSGDEGNETVRRGCPCNLHGRPCLRKCCPLGEVPTGGSECESLEHPFEFNVTDDGNDTYVVDGREHFTLLFGNPCKIAMFLLDPDVMDEFWIRSSDGAIIMPNSDKQEYGAMDFCLDYFPYKMKHLPLVCAEKIDDDSVNPVYIIYPIFMLFSIVFLFITYLVYALIQELRNLHGKFLMSQVGSLLFFYIFLVVTQLAGDKISDGLCIASAFILQFSFLATMFWLNVMCIDISLTFCGIQPLVGSVRERENKKFIIYSLYAWSCPLIFLIVSLIMDFAPGIPDHHLKPRFGYSSCWFHRKLDALAYIYGPVAVLITCNTIMLIITAIKLFQVNRQRDVLREEGRTGDDTENQNRFNLYLMLLVVMGVNWMMEVVSWAVGGPDYYWYLTDIGNTLQGFFIFLIFVCKDKVRNIVLQRICTKRSQGIPSSYRLHDITSRNFGTSGAVPSGFPPSLFGESLKFKSIATLPSNNDNEDKQYF